MKTDADSIQTGFDTSRFLLVLVMALVVAYTLSPFEFTQSRTGLYEGASEAAVFGSAIKILAHIVAFCGVGVLIASAYRGVLVCGLGRLLLIAAVVCIGIEVAQMLDASRHARITDLISNFAGLSLGLSSLRWPWVRVRVANLQEWLSRNAVRFIVSIFLLATGIWSAACLYPMFGLSKLDWDENFHLIIGNETDQSEPWLGEIRFIGIFAQANASLRSQGRERLPAKDADVGSKLLIGYDFTLGRTNEVVPAGLLAVQDLALDVPPDSAWAQQGGGILLTTPTLLSSRGSDAKLTEAIIAAGEFSIAASIRPLHRNQIGPARIVSLSEGIWSRNFMLGQEDSDVVFRVRNGVNGTNGLRHALRVRDALGDSLRDVVASYNHGVSSIAIDGKRSGPTVDLREPLVYLLLGSHEGGRAVGALLLTLCVALPAYSLVSFLNRSWLRHLIVAGVTVGAGCVPYGLTCLVVGGPWRLNLFFWFAIALVTVYPLGLTYVCRS